MASFDSRGLTRLSFNCKQALCDLDPAELGDLSLNILSPEVEQDKGGRDHIEQYQVTVPWQ